MDNVTDTPPIPAYITKDKSFIRELLHPSRISGLGLSLAEAIVNPGESTEEHYHSNFDEVYYCLEGAGSLFINGKEQSFIPHSCYLLPAGSRHRLNAATRLRLLCICCPGYTHEGTILTEQEA